MNKYVLVALVPLAACGTAERLANIGRAPKISPIEDVAAPAYEPSLGNQGYAFRTPNAAGDAAAPHATAAAPARTSSLYRTGARAFFRDQRASRVGDVLTVRINIADKAEVDNTTTRTRINSEDAQLPALLGFESKLGKVLPNAVDPNNLVNVGSQSRSTGNGQTQRKEEISLTLAAIVTGVLPNGNLVIRGRQEVRVNFEVRELVIAGIVRPEDISRDNTIPHTQIAEARVSYGGRGQLTDVQQARYGQQIYDALFPF
jgi:flagellar L-ring protein precursor FlgH